MKCLFVFCSLSFLLEICFAQQMQLSIGALNYIRNKTVDSIPLNYVTSNTQNNIKAPIIGLSITTPKQRLYYAQYGLFKTTNNYGYVQYGASQEYTFVNKVTKTLEHFVRLGYAEVVGNKPIKYSIGFTCFGQFYNDRSNIQQKYYYDSQGTEYQRDSLYHKTQKNIFYIINTCVSNAVEIKLTLKLSLLAEINTGIALSRTRRLSDFYSTTFYSDGIVDKEKLLYNINDKGWRTSFIILPLIHLKYSL